MVRGQKYQIVTMVTKDLYNSVLMYWSFSIISCTLLSWKSFKIRPRVPLIYQACGQKYQKFTLPQRSQKWSRTSEWADLTWTSNNLGSLKTRPQVSQIFWLWWNLITCFLRTPSRLSITNWQPVKENSCQNMSK